LALLSLRNCCSGLLVVVAQHVVPSAYSVDNMGDDDMKDREPKGVSLKDVPVFDGTSRSFSFWAVEFQACMVINDWWGVFRPMPVLQPGSEEETAWRRTNAKAFAGLVRALKMADVNSILHYSSLPDSAWQAWCHLSRKKQRVDNAASDDVHLKIGVLRQWPSESMDAYLDRCEGLCLDAVRFRTGFPERSFLRSVLIGLGPEWEKLSLELRRDGLVLTKDFIWERLLHEDSLIRSQRKAAALSDSCITPWRFVGNRGFSKSSTPVSAPAFTVSAAGPSPPISFQQGAGVNKRFKGGRKQKGRFGSARSKELGPCHICGKMGHLKRTCTQGQHPLQGVSGLYSQHMADRPSQPLQQTGGSIHRATNALTVMRLSMALAGVSVPEVVWIMDSGAGTHMTPHKHFFTRITDSEVTGVIVGDGSVLTVTGQGTVVIETSHGFVELAKTLLVPKLHVSLISLIDLDTKGYSINVQNGVMTVVTDDTTVLMSAQRRVGPGLAGPLFLLNTPGLTQEMVDVGHMDKGSAVVRQDEGASHEARPSSSPQTPMAAGLYVGASWDSAVGSLALWHVRCCHTGKARLQKAAELNLGMRLTDGPDIPEACPGCSMGKLHRREFKDRVFHATDKLQEVHADLIGKIDTQTRHRNHWALLLVDDFTGHSWLAFHHKKNQAAGKLQLLIASL
jgi:hypothetical protein